MDVVGREKGFAVTSAVEFVEPGRCRVCRHRGYEFGIGGLGVQEWLDCVGCLLGGHSRAYTAVGIVGLVKGEHPWWGIGASDEGYGCGNVGGEGHHGNVACLCVAGSARGAVQSKGDPICGRGYGIEHAGVEAAVEGYAFHVCWAAAGPPCGGAIGAWGCGCAS